MTHRKVSCLQATYGRYSEVCRSLACFLAQDYESRELVILNNHPSPLHFDHPKVRIVNEPGHPTLGHCRQRLLDFADGEFIRTWDDDDLYLPWAITQGVDNIGGRPAWQPKFSWATSGPDKLDLHANAFEASVTWRADFVKQHGYRLGMGDEHCTLIDRINDLGGMPRGDMGHWASYCYCWGLGAYHCSGSLGNGQTVEDRTAGWVARNQDTGDGQPLVPSSLIPWWRKIVRCVPVALQNQWMLAALGCRPKAVRVATTGCFDPLHPGHVDFLRWARRQGDHLTVLLNDDDGVAAQKGSDRPLVPYAGRESAILSIGLVDSVVMVSGVNDLPALEMIKPDIFVKGPDYAGREDSIPRPVGCELRIAPPGAFRWHTRDFIKAP